MNLSENETIVKLHELFDLIIMDPEYSCDTGVGLSEKLKTGMYVKSF